MENKKIIRNGIDVSGCEYFDHEQCNAGLDYKLCDDKPDCHYKKMMHAGAEKEIYKQEKLTAHKKIKDLEQEIETLKKQNDCNCLDSCCRKQEFEALKKQYKCYSCGTCNGKEDYVNMQRHCENAIKAVQKLNGEIDGLNEKLKEVLKLAKENADANEFCLQELEQKVETQDNTINTYREALTNILNCLIRNNYRKNSPICDTIWYETNCTLFDYIAFKCGIENLQEYEKEVLNDTI